MAEYTSEAGDKDWLIQHEKLPLKMIWVILRSEVSQFWFSGTLPAGAALGKARLLDFPLPYDLTKGDEQCRRLADNAPAGAQTLSTT